MSIFDAFDNFVIRLQFGTGARIEFYEAMTLLMENGVLLNDALKEMYKVASDEGRKPKNPRAIILYDCMMGVAEGRTLSTVLSAWVGPEECSLIAAGEKSGRLVDDEDGPGAFSQAIKVITAKRQIMAAILMATVYPTVLGALSVVLLNMVSTQLVPKLAKTTNPENWEGAAALLYAIAQFVTGYGKLALAGLLVLLAGIFGSLPYLRGDLRYYLDKVPPWSVYRMLHGSTFLLNVAVLLQAGIKLQDALALLSDTAKPWLKERIEAAKYGIGIGGNLGVALHKAGYDFPDRKAVQYLMILSNREGADKAIARFGDRWLGESIRKIQSTAKVALAMGVLLIGGLMLIVIAGAGGIQDAIQAGVRQ
jgi:type II secretory pathway component PulF